MKNKTTLSTTLFRMRSWLSITALSTLAACATVPQEAVELSYLVGRDLAKMQRSYDLLIEQRFEDYRAQRIAYLEHVWIPEFISEWIKEGRLIDTARGVVVFDETLDDFVAPTPGREQQQLLATIHEWSNAAVAEINDKRRTLLDPLDKDEQAIRNEAREAFDQLIQANAYITAHLNSLREVQDVQSQALDALGVKDVVEKLNNRLVEVSDNVQKGLDAIRKADGLVDEASEIRMKIPGTIRGVSP